MTHPRSDHPEQQRSAQRTHDDLDATQRLAKLGSWTWSQSGHATWSPQMFRMMGITSGVVPDVETMLQWIHPGDRATVERAARHSISTSKPFDLQFRLVRDGTHDRWVRTVAEIRSEQPGADALWGGYCQEITERVSERAQALRSATELRSLERVVDSIASGDSLTATLDAVCNAFELGHPGSKCSILLADHAERLLRHVAAPSLPTAFTGQIDGLAIADGNGACGTAAATGRLVVVDDALADPRTEAFIELARLYEVRSIWSTPIVDGRDNVLGTFAIYHAAVNRPDEVDIHRFTAMSHLAALAIESHRMRTELTKAGRTDANTGLVNRSRFVELLDQHLATPGCSGAVLYVALDGFKFINDCFGQRTGNRVIADVASRLEAARADDEIVARAGGDQFAILIRASDHETADEAIERIHAVFGSAFVVEHSEIFLSASVGVAICDGTGDGEDLLGRATMAVHAAKTAGRGTVQHFDEQLRRRSIARVTLGSELRRAIEHDEFVMFYQPILDLRTGRWDNIEALVRWIHPTRGIISPDEFIPFAEETGLIVALGAKVLDMSVRQAVELETHGIHVGVSVNVSAVQLVSPNIIDIVTNALDQHGLDSSRLTIEVTETAVMKRYDTARSALAKLTGIGARVVIDDFGTGESSIARLGDLYAVGVKIDRHVAAILDDTAGSFRAMTAIVDLAHALDLEVVTEGVETRQMLERTRATGCDYAQGHHIAPPLPFEDLIAAFARRADRSYHTP